MVFYTLTTLAKNITKKTQLKFIDTLRLHVKGGHGGNGFPKYGGVGGQGGCVYLVATDGVSLKDVSKKNKTSHVHAGAGKDSLKDRLIGRRGADIKVEVPVGIKAVDDAGKIIGELNTEGEKCVAAGGGVGGCSGNNFIGTPGQERTVTLDLKLIADVGLVGFPNAGKSTLLKAISRAKPKIAAYPFTTIRPQIGTVEYKDYRQVTVADLPGLIEGAHMNVGMGYKFLKHVERTKLLLMVVDLFGFKLSTAHHHRTCLENIYALNKELEMYDKELLQKPCILLLNKTDIEGSEIEYEKVRDKLHNLKDHVGECRPELVPEEFIKFDRIMTISAQSSTGIEKTKNTVRDILDYYAEQKLLSDQEEKEPESKSKESNFFSGRGR